MSYKAFKLFYFLFYFSFSITELSLASLYSQYKIHVEKRNNKIDFKACERKTEKKLIFFQNSGRL